MTSSSQNDLATLATWEGVLPRRPDDGTSGALSSVSVGSPPPPPPPEVEVPLYPPPSVLSAR